MTTFLWSNGLVFKEFLWSKFLWSLLWIKFFIEQIFMEQWPNG